MKVVYTGKNRLLGGYEAFNIGDLMLLSDNAEEAAELGDAFYFTGICKSGHLAVRRVSNKRCLKCEAEKLKTWLENGGQEVRNEYATTSYSENPEVKARKTARNNLLRVLELSKLNKYGKTFDILGYSAVEFREHIESLFQEGMTLGDLK